jgi:hypothetical protein
MDATVELLSSKARTTFGHHNIAMSIFLLEIHRTLRTHHVRLTAGTDDIMDWPVLHVRDGGCGIGKERSAGMRAQQ